jgi:hypothetical protein
LVWQLLLGFCFLDFQLTHYSWFGTVSGCTSASSYVSSLDHF